ncbi:MAG: hypothetical protein Q9M43_12395 [Sulfurimonas sp.]|nr:hypothetical protein [Sulfurimonas sp.]
MIILKSINEYREQIATYIKSLRLEEGTHTQRTKASQCGIAFGTYVKLENVGKGSIEMLLKVLSSYGLLSKIDELTKIIELSPSEKISQAKIHNKKRVRHSVKENKHD